MPAAVSEQFTILHTYTDRWNRHYYRTALEYQKENVKVQEKTLISAEIYKKDVQRICLI